MSQATVRHLTGSAAQQGLDGLLGGLPEFVNGATTQYVALLRRGMKLAGDMLPANLTQLAGDSNACCSVPTQDCPPRCVAEIDWEACAGEVQHAVIHVKNSGHQARDFSFQAGNLGPAKVEVSPPSAQLAPGQSVAVRVDVAPSEAFKPGETYSGELLIRGAYEQCVRLRLRVARPATATLELCQGEVPERITELKWYRHWQCTEPCIADRVPGTTDVASHNPNVRG